MPSKIKPLELIGTTLLTLNKKGDMSLSTRQPTTVSWGHVETDELDAFSFHTPTKIVTPPEAQFVRFSASVVFPAKTGGYRQLWTRKNGFDYPLGYLSHSQYGGFENGSSNSFPAIGPIVPTLHGDYWELMVKQDSGGDLALSAKNSTWFQAEWFTQ